MPSCRWLQYAALGIAIAIACPVAGQEASNERPDQQQETAQEAQQQPTDEAPEKPNPAATDYAPAVGEPPGQEHRANQESPERAKAQEPLPWYSDRSIWGLGGDTIAQWLMAVAGIAATGISIAALILVRRTLETTRQAAEYTGRALVQAEITTGVAQEALTETRSSNERQLRAYVTVDSISVQNLGDQYSYKVIWKNTGNTPAQNVTTFNNWDAVLGDDLPENFEYPPREGVINNDAAVLGAAQRLDSWPAMVPFETIQRINAGIQTLFIWGAAEYDDMFADTPRHRTEFCYNFSIEFIQGADGGQIGIGQRIYGPHNGIDETCHKQPE